VKCPTCDYEFEPAGDLQCPRCGAMLSCSTTACAECDACSGIVEQLRRSAADRLRVTGEE